MALSKDEISRQMVEFYKNHLFVLFLITMGGGKTKGSLDCVTHLYGYTGKGVIVCHSANSRDKIWPKEIKQYHPELENAIKSGIVSLTHKDHILNLPIDTYDWVIWDEVHTMKREHLMWIKLNHLRSLILMTGTESSDEFMARNTRKAVKQAVFEFPTEQAIDEGLINDYRVKIIEVPLSEADTEIYKGIAAKITTAKAMSNQTWLEMVQGERMRFIYGHHSKVNVIKDLDKLLEHKRRLLFMATKDACAEVSPYIFHSSTKEEHFLLFARGDIPKLASVRQLKTGSNIFGFDTIINQQFNSKYENFMQTLGRLFRLSPGQVGTIYALYIKDTQDQSWFDKASFKVPSHKKRTYDLTKTSLQEIVNDTF